MYRFHGDKLGAHIQLASLYKLNILLANDISADAGAIFQAEVRHFPCFCVAGKHFRLAFNHVEAERRLFWATTRCLGRLP